MKKTYGFGFQKQYEKIKKEKESQEKINEVWTAYGLDAGAKKQMNLLISDMGVPFDELESTIAGLHRKLCGFGSDIIISAEVTGLNGDSKVILHGYIDKGICSGHEEKAIYSLGKEHKKQYSLC